ncbi:J domain-containing protein [Spiroplasma culicicola]|uniref:J domain-containing protein n=1 Tax=Spiroplasma culicicola AES-1 TaxID=1276246 RepID=W6A6M8_9MOLU|nr:J domain-containing protein [Spiroplasma culicicola]AHI52626.1 hypothetical protein SCULI_v1c02850 [Spiroplasma culicicola AES-1]
MSILNIIIISGSILGVLFLILLIVLNVRHVKKNRVNKINISIKHFKKRFSSHMDKHLMIPKYNYIEVFDIFPFKSNFSKTYEKFQSKGLTSYLKQVQFLFEKEWMKNGMRFFDFYVKFTRELGIYNSIVLKSYTKLTSRTFELYRRVFVNEVMPSIIAKYHKQDYGLTSYERIDFFIEEQFNEFEKSLVILTDHAINMIATQIVEETEFDYRYYTKIDYNENLQSTKSSLLNAYEVLQFKPNGTDSELKKAYVRLIKKYHPDNVKLGDEQKIIEINNAYELIQKYRNA